MSFNSVRKRDLYPVNKLMEKTLAMDLFFTDLNSYATCLICKHKVLFREFNMRRHYKAKHSEAYDKYQGADRKKVSDQLNAEFNLTGEVPAKPDVRNEPKPEQKSPGNGSSRLVSTLFLF